MSDRRTRSGALLLAGMALLAGCDRFTSDATRVARAEARLKEGNYQAALVEVRKVVDSSPSNTEARLLLADALFASGDIQAARQQLDQAAAAGAAAAAIEPRLITVLLASDREAARNALANSEALSAAQRAFFEGRLFLLDRNPKAAQEAFDRALAAEPEMEDAALGRIEAMAGLGRSTEASKAADDLVSRKPQSGRAWILKGALAMQASDFASAAKAFSTALEPGHGLTRPETVQTYNQLVESYLATGALDSARTALAGFEAATGETAAVLYSRARVALASGDPTTAVNELRRLTQAAPGFLAGRLLLSSALIEQGSKEQALTEAVRNVSDFPESDEPRVALARIQLGLGRVADAEKTLQPLISRSPPSALAIATLADVRIRRGEAIAGASLLEQTVAQEPNPRLQLQLAAAYLASGQPKRAMETLESVKEPTLSAARDRLHVIATAALHGSVSASKELAAAVARYPKDVDLLLMAAAYHAGRDEFDQARSYLVRARELRPGDTTLMLALGRLELSAGNLEDAEKMAQASLATSPNDSASMMLMARIANQRGRAAADVDAWLNRARLADPDSLEVRMAVARRAIARGNIGEARALLEEAARNSPSDPATLIALAEVNATAGRYAEAMESLKEASRVRPDSPAILLAMAKVQLASKDTAGARKNLRQAFDLAPHWLPVASTLAAIEVSAGNLSGALDVARKIRRVDPEGVASFAIEGEVYMSAKRPADAAKVLVAAYQRSPNGQLATRAAQAKVAAKLPAPEAELASWLTLHPDDATARRTLADVLMAVGKSDKAIQELEQVLIRQPRDAASLNNLAWLYHEANDERALATAEKAYAVAPDVAAVADTYGWILIQGGKTDEGVKILEKAAQLAPNDPQIQFHFAYGLSEAGEMQRARQILQTLLASGQRFESLAEARSLLTRLGS